MSGYEPPSPQEDPPAHPESSSTPGTSVAGGSGGTGAGPTPPPASSPDSSASAPTGKQGRRQPVQRFLSTTRRRWIVATAALCAVVGLSAGLATSLSGTAAQPASNSSVASGPGSGGGASNAPSGPGAGGASNARSGPAAGGTSGTVGSLSMSSFTVSTSAGQKVTIDETSSTTYQRGTSSTSASAVTTGEPVLVLGTTNGETITATQVVVQPTGGGSAGSSAAGVVPFERGAPTTSKQVGQIPADFSQGSGTIVSGTAANKATEAALAAYPGGVVDRVVQLSNGEYNVHYIGVNWPHHVFVNQSFTVVGAE
jgi:hypothetical protein